MNIYFDVETRSIVDLKKSGAYVYADHPTTDVLCMGYAFDDGPVKLWKLGESPPSTLGQALESDAKFIAHNAQFDHIIWNRVCVPKYGWPKLPIENTHCTMVMAYALGLPGSLERAASALGLEVEKDMKAQRVMLQLCKPRQYRNALDFTWWEAGESEWIADKYETLYSYCANDIEVHRALHKRLLSLSKTERKAWVLDQKINDRGVLIDIDSVEQAIKVIDEEKDRLNEEIEDLTGGAVGKFSYVSLLLDWVKSHGIEAQNLAKSSITEILTKKNLPREVRRALSIRQRGAKSSTAKLEAMRKGANRDGRVRGCFQFNGASSTGRWSGRRIQLQNLPRGNVDERYFWALNHRATDLFYPDPIEATSENLRGFLWADKGKRLLVCDFASIEARVLAWLAGEEKVLEVFRGDGKLYEHAAASIYKKPVDQVTKEERQIGKVAVLALGYNGGKGAFQAMAKGYRVEVTDTEAENIKKAWRKEHPNIENYWYALENAAISAVQNTGKQFKAGAKGREITYLMRGNFLFARLPSSRAISYPFPRLQEMTTPWGAQKIGLTYMGEDRFTRKWERQKAYGGLLCENGIQATARDILRDSMFRLEKKGYPTIAHCHDEVICEMKEGVGSVREMERIMCASESWAKGLPVAAEGFEAKRYSK